MCPEPRLNRYHILQVYYFDDDRYNGPRRLKEGGRRPFLRGKGDHCEIKHVRVCCSVHK